MKKRLRDKHGFSLMEIMIVVAIAGILASIAVPTFTMLMNRSKSGEVTANLNSMFKAASAYYSAERTPQGGIGSGGGANVTGYCVVGAMAGPLPATGPTKSKQRLEATSDPSLKALGFAVADSVYFAYQLHSTDGDPDPTCGHSANSSDLYTFSAYGNLDGDAVWSTFELAVGSDRDNVLYHGLGFYVDRELE
jgi:prepilin-type N-terminal cleavage/methylation domain-containing protein